MGVFIALYVALVFLCGMLMGLVPLIMVALPIILGLLGGLIFTVLLGKVQRGDATVEVARRGTELLNPFTMLVLCALTVVAGVVGCWWGRALTRTQLSRAGIV